MSSTAVCIRCGHFKAEGVGICKSCGFQPRAFDDRMRSLYLEPRFFGEGTVPLTSSELESASSIIKAGESFTLDRARLAKVTAEHKRAMRRAAAQFSLIFAIMLVALLFLYLRAFLT